MESVPARSHSTGIVGTRSLPLNKPKRMRLATNEMMTAMMESCALSRASRRVNNVMPAAAASGVNRTIHGRMFAAFIGSVAQRGQVFDVSRLFLAVQRHDQRQSDRNLSGGNGDDEEDHDLPIEIVVETRERDQREIRCVEHQLKGHIPVSYTHLRAHETPEHLVCRLLL